MVTLTRCINKVLFIIGPPGSGKGTLCNELSKSLKITTMSAGDLLRAEVKKPYSKQGKKISELIDNGNIVPASITIQLLLENMDRLNKENNEDIFIIDGFPRNIENYSSWKQMTTGIAEILKVIHLDLSDEVCLSRCLGRAASTQPSQNRSDDNEETIKKRLQVAKESTNPVCELLEGEGLLVRMDSDCSKNEMFSRGLKLAKDLINDLYFSNEKSKVSL